MHVVIAAKLNSPLWHCPAPGNICPQQLEAYRAIEEAMCLKVQEPGEMSEDCLFLNVFTPNLDPDAKLSVMFWIHGGGLIQGVLPGNDLTGVAVQFATRDQKNATQVQKCIAIFNIKVCYYVVLLYQVECISDRQNRI